MLLHHINKFLRHISLRATYSYRNFVSANTETDSTERDPALFFFDKETQEILKTLTTVNYEKVFRIRQDGHKLKPPQYKFLTDEELQEARKAAERKANKYLQMPPVVKQRLDLSVPLCEDSALQSYDTVKYVFTDITYGLNDRSRLIVIREPNGTLRHANWQERDKMLQIYFPKPGRELRIPKMFKDEYLQSLLTRNKYEFILDRACVQFEPDDPDYQAITRKVYEYINKEKHYNILRSTRHFGPMVFHLIWTSNIDDLLCEMIETSRIKDATLLIRLYHKIHPTAKSAVNQCEDMDDIKFIMHYANLESPKKSTIVKLVQSYMELQQEQQIVSDGIKKAHGILLKTDNV